MKNLPINYLTHINKSVTTLATCVKLTLTSGEKMGFTTHVRPIIIADDPTLTYTPYGFAPTAVQSSSAFNVDNLDIQGFLDSESITEADIISKKYDFADIEIFKLNYEDRPYNSTKIEKMRKGKLGEIKLSKGMFVAEIRGQMEYLQRTIGEQISPNCRATLGDSKCKKVLTSFTSTHAVTTVLSQRSIISSTLTGPFDYFKNGKITFLTGENAGLVMDVVKYFAGSKQLDLGEPMAYQIEVGDTFSAVAGCNKTITTCKSVFNNVINFRGEQFLPGIDFLSTGKKGVTNTP